MTIITRFADPKDPLNKDKFVYRYTDGKQVTDKTILEWIFSLRIPPAWTEVKIWYGVSQPQTCCGRDGKGRLQCLYGSAHKEKAKKQKYCSLIKFGEVLPSIQADIKAALDSARYTKNKIIAIILSIVMSCGFRIGTAKYESDNDSFGISTIHREHIRFDSKGAHIEFIGKKQVHNSCTVTDPKIVSCLRDLVLAKTNDLHVMVYQLGGENYHISHLDINAWLRERGETFTSKNFRTWQANIVLIDYLRDKDPNGIKPTARKKNINEAGDKVSETIHNTRAVSKSQYCDPEIIEMYVEHPVTYRKWFITPNTPARNMFINYLKWKCSAS